MEEHQEELAPLKAQEVQPLPERSAGPPPDAFDALDTNHDGQVDRGEFERAMAAKEQLRSQERSFMAQEAVFRPPNSADSLAQLQQQPLTQAPPAARSFAPQIG